MEDFLATADLLDKQGHILCDALCNFRSGLLLSRREKRVPLTYDEASTYLLIDYLGTHKGASLPATPALARVTDETRSRLGAQFTRTYFVKVSKDGKPQEAYLDAACSQKVADPYLSSVINDVRFNPALEKGQPTGGIAQLTLDSLPTL